MEIQGLGGKQTAVFDLREIRDKQVPDKDGNVIPRSVVGGQFRWSVVGGAGLSRLIGRTEVVSLSNRVSSSFSCPTCCPDSFLNLDLTPAVSTGAQGGSIQLAVDGFLIDCSLRMLGPFNWSVSSWWVQKPNVISLSMVTAGTAQMNCLEAGQSDFEGTTVETWYDSDGIDCFARTDPFTGPGTGGVRPQVSISVAAFSPASVTPPGNPTSRVTFTVSASPASAEGLQPGDFAVVEIIKDTGGGNFTYVPSSQMTNVTLDLGGAAQDSFDVTAVEGTPPETYRFIIRISDVRRPSGGGSSSILSQIVLNPSNGSQTQTLMVN